MKRIAAIVFAAVFALTLLACGKLSVKQDAAETAQPAPTEAPVTAEPIVSAEPIPDTQEPAATPEPTAAPLTASDIQDAVLQEYIDENGKDTISVSVTIPANATLVIDFPNQADYEFTNTEPKSMQRIIRIPVEVFYLNVPLTESTVVLTPKITIIAEDGTVFPVPCDSFTRTFPSLTVTVLEPIPDENGVIMAPESNVIRIRGVVDPVPDPVPDAITVNGVSTEVYEDGGFVYEYHLRDGIGEDETEEITIVARKNNHVTAEKTITVHAYKFVPEPMLLKVRTGGSALRTDENGKVTVSGVTLPGASLSAVSDNTSSVLCGSVTVDSAGNFSFQITTDPAFFGISVITVSAEKDGAESATAQFTVAKGFEDKTEFLKYYSKTKTYYELNAAGGLTVADLLAKPEQYATEEYGFRVSATVTEVMEADGGTIVKMTVLKTNETIYVRNLNPDWTPEDRIGSKYNVYGNFIGTYENTGCCEFLGWFVQNIK
jgi:hypothetical protein